MRTKTRPFARVAAATLVAAFALLPAAPASACDEARPDCTTVNEVVGRYTCVVRALANGEQPYPACASHT